MDINAQKNKLAWRIRITFAGNQPCKEYITPDVRSNDPGWASKLFNREIESLEFFLPTGHRIVLAGMEKYNFFIEATQSSKGRDSAEINAFWFCGKLPGENVVEMWRIGNGKAIRDRKPWGHEWGGGPTRGWKTGTCGETKSILLTV